MTAHLESCADCRAELSAWEATTALLALDAEALEPSAHVRERVLAGARESRESREYREDREAVKAQANLSAGEVQAGRAAGAVGVDRTATVAHAGDSVSGSGGAPLSDSKVLAFARPRKSVWASLGSFGAIAATLVGAAFDYFAAGALATKPHAAKRTRTGLRRDAASKGSTRSRARGRSVVNFS